MVRACAARRPGVLPAGLGTLRRRLRDPAAVLPGVPVGPGPGHSPARRGPALPSESQATP